MNLAMKHIVSIAAFLLLSAVASAQLPMVQITARYEGFGLSLADVLADHKTWKSRKPTGLLSAPQVTTRSGQPATVQVIRATQVPQSPNRENSIDAGLTLEVQPVIKNGRIALSGKSVLRRRLDQGGIQPINALSFATRETFFNGIVGNGEELAIAIGDGPRDKARIVLKVELIDASGRPVHLPQRLAARARVGASKLQ